MGISVFTRMAQASASVTAQTMSPIRCILLVLSTLVQTSWANGYLTGETSPVLWQTFTKVDSCNASNTIKSTEMILTNPNDQGIYLTYDKPDTIYTLQSTPVVVKLSLANTFTIVENGYAMLPHVNIHSCNADAGACTPFVKNTPGLSTHTAAIKRNLTTTHTPGRWSMDETLNVNLPKGSYMMIAHVRFFTSQGKWDVAYGTPVIVEDENDNTQFIIFVCLVTFAGLVFAAAAVFMIRFIYKAVQEYAALKEMKEKLVKQKLDAALEASQHLDYPVTLVSANDFMAHGRLRQHEDVRDENQLVFKDSLAKVAVFKKTYKIVFFSHQWTAWTEPDHTSKQYKAMVEALQTVVTDFGWDLNKVYVWVDYISIPQCVGSVQLLAIHTLTAYSSVADAFIAVCPDLEHKETSASVGVESYKHRMWCRAEQACFALKNGCDNMWMCTEMERAPGDESKKLTLRAATRDKSATDLQSMDANNDGAVDAAEFVAAGGSTQEFDKYDLNGDGVLDAGEMALNVERMDTDWVQEVLKVFDGNPTCCERKHVGMDACDRQALVVPLLSLYSEWFAAQDADAHLRVVNNVSKMFEQVELKQSMFPETFGFVHADGTTTHQNLFGNLIHEMENYLIENPQLKDLLNGIEVKPEFGVVPKRPAMDDEAKVVKGTAKVRPEDQCNISVRTADGTTIEDLDANTKPGSMGSHGVLGLVS